MAAIETFGGRWFVPVALALALVMAIGVFKAKTDAAAARKRVAEKELAVAAKRDEARGLAAEVQFLENPRRIEALARRELAMAPATPDQKKPASEAFPASPPAPTP
jgi:cell division protein FtsL